MHDQFKLETRLYSVNYSVNNSVSDSQNTPSMHATFNKSRVTEINANLTLSLLQENNWSTVKYLNLVNHFQHVV